MIAMPRFGTAIGAIADGHAANAARTSATVVAVVSDRTMWGCVEITMFYHRELDKMVDLSQSVMQFARH